MLLFNSLKFVILTTLTGSVIGSKTPATYPILSNNGQIQPRPYTSLDSIPVECIQRQIDTGEHKFDSNNQIIYDKFPVCAETGDSLALKFNDNSKFNCTFKLTDEIYHLFQLYIHEDSPFSCRVLNYKGNGAKIPFTFNLRGNLENSHLDIDTKLNILGLVDSAKGQIGSVVAFSSGEVSQKYIIDDLITLEFNNVWYDNKASNDFFQLKISSFGFWSVVGLVLVTSFITGVIIIWLVYGSLNKKALKLQSSEFGIEKKD